MDDRTALLRAVVESPLDDTPRLIYADWLDEHADDGPTPEADRARAEFVRCQVELARIPKRHVLDGEEYLRRHGERCWEAFVGVTESSPLEFGIGDRVDVPKRIGIGGKPKSPLYGLRVHRIVHEPESLTASVVFMEDSESVPDTSEALRRRERELLRQCGSQFLGRVIDWYPDTLESGSVVWCQPVGRSATHVAPVEFRRGFLDSITCSWNDWLAIEQSVAWCPGVCLCRGNPDIVSGIDSGLGTCLFCSGTGRTPPTMACPECNWNGSCAYCSGSGRVPRLFLASMQPLTAVTLTTWPQRDWMMAACQRHKLDWRQWGPGDSAEQWAILLAAEWPGLTVTLPAAWREGDEPRNLDDEVLSPMQQAIRRARGGPAPVPRRGFA